MKFAQSYRLTAYTLAFICSFIFCTLVLSVGIQNIWQSYTAENIKGLTRLSQQLRTEIESNLYGLHFKLMNKECGEDIIEQLQQAEITSRYLRAYEFIAEENSKCSSYSIKLSDHSYPTSGNVRSKSIGYAKQFENATKEEKVSLEAQLGDSEYDEIIYPSEPPLIMRVDNSNKIFLSLGHIRAFFFKNDLMSTNLSWMSQTLFTLSETHRIKMIGSYSDYENYEGTFLDGDSYYDNLYWFYYHCYGDLNGNCSLIKVDMVEFFEHRKAIVYMYIIAILFAFFMFSFVFIKIINYYMSLNQRVKRGINENQVICFYQPIISCKTGKITGCEVLARWLDEEGNLVTPDKFLPEVEANQQTLELTEVVLSKAIAELSDYNLLGHLRLAFNTFPNDVASGKIQYLLKKHVPKGLESCITVEITEEEISNMEAIERNIKILRSYGYSVAIDDFGTGYSNFEHLQRLQVDILKIDRSFITGIEDKMVRASIVSNIIELAKLLNLRLIAEGVENKEQFDILCSMLVDSSQGFLHSKPVPITRFNSFVYDNFHR